MHPHTRFQGMGDNSHPHKQNNCNHSHSSPATVRITTTPQPRSNPGQRTDNWQSRPSQRKLQSATIRAAPAHCPDGVRALLGRRPRAPRKASAHCSDGVRALLGKRPRTARTASARSPDGGKCPRTTNSVCAECVRAHRKSVRCVRATRGRKFRPRFCRIPSARTLRTRSDAFLLALGHFPLVRGRFGRFSLRSDSAYKALGCIRSAQKPRGHSLFP